MAQSPELLSHGPWKRGVNTLASDQALGTDELRNAVNVDLTKEGHGRRRPGFTSRYATKTHSIWSDGQTLYGVTNDNLSFFTRAANGTLTPTTLRAGFPSTLPVAWLALNERVFYSNGIVTGMIYNKTQHYPWGTENPAGQPTLTASSSGGLHAGRYQIAVTFVSSLGEEGGTGQAAAVDVAAGGGISLSAIPQPKDASVTKIRIYRTEANADVFYLYGEYAVGTTSASVGASNSLGKVLDTQFLYPPPPGGLLEAYNGRIYIVAGSVIWYTEALRPGAIRMTNFKLWPSDINLFAAVDNGIIVGSEAIDFLQGSDPKNMVLLPRLPFGAVKGTLVRDTKTKTLTWFSPQGLCRADAQGNMAVVNHNVTFEHADQGAALLREVNGIRQVVGVMKGGAASTLTNQDLIDAEAVRKTP